MGRTACTEPQFLYKGALYLFYLMYISILQDFVMQLKMVHLKLQLLSVLWKAVAVVIFHVYKI